MAPVNDAVHICLISEQALPNLLPLLLEKPGRAIFLVSSEMTLQAERLRQVLVPHGIKVEIRTIKSAFDFAGLVRLCETINNEIGSDADLVLNTTGGTKIAALAAFQVFFFADRRIIYLDTSQDQLLELSPSEQVTTITENLIKVKDCLVSYGMSPLPTGKATGAINRGPALEKLVDLLVQDEVLLGRLNNAIGSFGNNPAYINLPLNGLGEKADKLVELLEQCKVASITSQNSLNIPTADKVFFCQGGWLEEYVYSKVRELGYKGLDAAINVKVKWDGKGRRPTENELDVLFTHNNRLHIISCKTADPDRVTDTGSKATEALNELDALKDRAGGLFVKAMLASARPLREADRERAKKMKINILDGPKILGLKKHLPTWLNSKEY